MPYFAVVELRNDSASEVALDRESLRRLSHLTVSVLSGEKVIAKKRLGETESVHVLLDGGGGPPFPPGNELDLRNHGIQMHFLWEEEVQSCGPSDIEDHCVNATMSGGLGPATVTRQNLALVVEDRCKPAGGACDYTYLGGTIPKGAANLNEVRASAVFVDAIKNYCPGLDGAGIEKLVKRTEGHEVGHAVGMEHKDYGSSLMTLAYALAGYCTDPPTTFDAEDLQQIALH